MKSLYILTLLFTFTSYGFAQIRQVERDSTDLNFDSLVGRWIEEKVDQPNNIYVFRKDSCFFKAVDNNEGVLLFNVPGRFFVKDDSIKIVYYTLQAGGRPARINNMIFRVLNQSPEELNIEKIERNRSTSIYLKKASF